MAELADIHALWVGSQIGKLEAACLESFARHGHSVTLHTYGKVDGIPKSTRLADAENVISSSEIFRQRDTNSLGMFADIFRYELFDQCPSAVYVDCDVYCVKPLKREDYLFGFEKPKQLNGAVLSLPRGSAVLEELRQLRLTGHLRWPWEKRFPFAPLRLGNLFHRSENPLSDKLWATTGPFALTYCVKKHGLLNKAKPKDYFYPVSFGEVARLFEPGRTIESFAKEDTHCVHLYNEAMKAKGLKIGNAAKGSAIWNLLQS